MQVARCARRIITVAALGTALLGGTASLASAAPPEVPPGQTVQNYGTCVANPEFFPEARDSGPLTSNRNRFNVPRDDRGSYIGCNVG